MLAITTKQLDRFLTRLSLSSPSSLSAWRMKRCNSTSSTAAIMTSQQQLQPRQQPKQQNYPLTSSANFTSTTANSSSSSSNLMNEKKKEKREIVQFLRLNSLSDNPGAIKTKRRVGRGIGSSKGKTCGRGHKGQKARSGGGPSPLFEGGQTKFYKRIPKRGFKNSHHAQPMLPINVGTLQDYIDMGRLPVPQQQQDEEGNNDNSFLTMKDLVDVGLTKTNAIKHGVKLLAKGKERLRSPIRIHVSRASSAAIEAIESVGGEVTTVHYNKLALRALLKPEKFDVLPKRARPPPRLMPYYTSYEKRGYLSPEVQLKGVKKRLAKEREGGSE